MSNEPKDALPVEPPTEPPRGRGVLFWVLLGVGLLVLFSCLCGGGLFWWVWQEITTFNQNQLARVFREALADGDWNAAYDRADVEFRREHSREAFQRYIRDNQNVFDRSKLTPNHVVLTSGYVLVRVDVQGRNEPVEFFCRVLGDGTLVLLGISPGLDLAVSPELHRYLREGGRKRDWFDD